MKNACFLLLLALQITCVQAKEIFCEDWSNMQRWVAPAHVAVKLKQPSETADLALRLSVAPCPGVVGKPVLQSFRTFAVVPGRTYSLSFEIGSRELTANGAKFDLRIEFTDEQGKAVAAPNGSALTSRASGEWTLLERAWTAPAGASEARLLLNLVAPQPTTVWTFWLNSCSFSDDLKDEAVYAWDFADATDDWQGIEGMTALRTSEGNKTPGSLMVAGTHQGGAAYLISKPILLEKGKTYRLDGYLQLKAISNSQYRPFIQVADYGTGGNWLRAKNTAPYDNGKLGSWQRFSCEFTPGADAESVRILLHTGAPGQESLDACLLLDDLRIILVK